MHTFHELVANQTYPLRDAYLIQVDEDPVLALPRSHGD